jgi:hypothetical protein
MIMKPADLLVVFCVAAALPTPAQASLVTVSNLGQTPPTTTTGIGGNTLRAGSVTVNGSNYALDSVTLRMGPGGTGGTFKVQLFTNNGSDLPGSPLATLSGNADPKTTGDYTYTTTGTLNLTANTTYWVVASAPSGSGYIWQSTASTAENPGSIWTIGNERGSTLDGGATWNTPISVHQFSVSASSVSAVPEPGSLVLAGVAGSLFGGGWLVRKWRTKTASKGTD